MFRLYYGAVPELTEQFDAPIRTRIFTKAWKEEDPNRVIALSHSRPLPVPHRPRAVFSFTVLS